ncbi:twin-arginine translocase subunit TatB [Actinopolyspora erythraea]|uniref:Sec-independent protein translocase protein TatB n=1 Tax=Actinopolyspora erythraea TaxID=414996 RepID=A0A099D0Z4_9ACTN|nr:Sec-independent protein translocase protein TatB [Actinopolyspora erythraea]ASU79779.1 twin-arginine translocase subunit TatB [Actinopolyspora erythraea]KGI79596.1 preprotein translocase subunit TatB [Actinopolyspora erythraea]
MFDSIGWGEILVLIVAGLFILGPERLPSAAAWLGKTVREVREYATGARDQLRSEMGPEFDELRKPLEDLRGIRDFDPRRAVSKHLFDDENPLDGITNGNGTGANGHKSRSDAPRPSNRREQPLDPGERPPFDSDAT